MSRSRVDDEVELDRAPVFRPGERVRDRCRVRNDGTHPASAIGTPLIVEGDVGYVREIGTFLQRYWIYAVEWPDRGLIVGMRGHELAGLDRGDGFGGLRAAEIRSPPRGEMR